MVKEPTVISIFAGCGGSSLGYKLAGYKELLAIDFDKNCEATFNLNFPNVPFWRRDIKTVTSEEILKFCNIKKGELDLLDGSPPCQGFSTAGKRKVLDPRNDLFKEYTQLIIDLEPKVFIMENVSGLVKGTMKGRFKEIMNTLKSLNYNVKCKLLNAMYYDVPQSRQRLFWIGIRKDLDKQPIFPIPSNKIITVKEALKNCPLDLEIYYPTKTLQNLIYKCKQGEQASKYHIKGNYFNVIKLNYNKPSNTITKTFIPGAAGLIHPTENRFLTISELKRLTSFPDNFQFIGKFAEQWARIGNAVMPNQMKAIAQKIKEEILL